MLNSKKAVCDWIMGMTAEEYFDFMGSVSNNMPLLVIKEIPEEIFYSCSQCEKEHGEECEENDMDDLSKCFRFFCEHYGIRGRDSHENF